jgi:hypothetical protein
MGKFRYIAEMLQALQALRVNLKHKSVWAFPAPFNISAGLNFFEIS